MVDGGCFDLLDLCLVDIRVAVLDHPEVEPLEQYDIVMQGVLLKRPAATVLRCLERRDAVIDLGNCIRAIGPDIPPPVDKSVGEFVEPHQAQTLCRLQLGDELPDQIDVVADESALDNRPIDRPIGIVALDAMKVPVLPGDSS